MKLFISFLLGTLFSVGLSISGMVNPDKVIGYLDFFGTWDPALMFVMGGGVGVNFILFKLILKRENPILEEIFSVPSNNLINKKLVIGAALFGVGWGLGGMCPGPGLSNLFLLSPKVIAFLVSMLIGMLVYRFTDRHF